MALTATPAALTADTDFAEAVWPEWHRWFNPITKRWWAARTSVPVKPLVAVMLISADTYGELLTAAVHASAPSVRAA